MELLDSVTAPRNWVIATAVYTFGLALFVWRMPNNVSIWGAISSLAVGAYALCSTSNAPCCAANWTVTIQFVILYLCAALPAIFWSFVMVLFDDAATSEIWRILITASLGLLGLIIHLELFDTATVNLLFSVTRRLVGLGLMVWSIWIVWYGINSDLITSRIWSRRVLLGVTGLYVMGVLIVELTLHELEVPTWLQSINLITIAIITMVIGISMSSWQLHSGSPGHSCSESIETEATPDRLKLSTPSNPTNSINKNPAQSLLIDRLHHAMTDEQLYRQEKLTIRALAEKLDTSEHRLRTAINQSLGFRNFNEFLHHYRLDEVTERLRDPSQASVPVLTIALDAGYASIGPFNRAFKARFEQTPTAYREQNLTAQSRNDS